MQQKTQPPFPENAAYERILACLDYRLADARSVLAHGYELPLAAADAMILHACVRFIAGLEAVNPAPVAFRARVMALLVAETKRAAKR